MVTFRKGYQEHQEQFISSRRPHKEGKYGEPF